MEERIRQFIIRMQKHNMLLTIILLSISTGISFFFFNVMHENTGNIALIYILVLILISRWTSSYVYGIFASLVCVVCINFLFTYPYFQLNFTLSGYPVTFLVTLFIAVITSTTTTHMKQQEKILADKEKQLAAIKAEKIKANLLRAISHDLRTPLTSIIGASSSYINNNNSYTEDEKLELVYNVQEDAIWLLNMVENLLSITRIQNDINTLKTSPEVIDEVISEAVMRLKKRVPNAEVTIQTPDDFLMIPMDAMLIEQVIINLLENALTHSQSTLAPLLSVDTTAADVTFHVYDYGIGIDEQKVSYLFDGTSGSSVSADGKKGMGIGLSICKTIIMAHHGIISARNHTQGTEFYFTLPKEVHDEN